MCWSIHLPMSIYLPVFPVQHGCLDKKLVRISWPGGWLGELAPVANAMP